MELKSFEINKAGFDKQFRSWGGETGQWLKVRVGDPLAIKARENAPKPGKATGRTGISFAKGELASNIIIEQTNFGPDLQIKVVANSPHAVFVHGGTRPHDINARLAPEMIFFWHKVGRTVFRKHVRHPGTRAVPFLRDALESIMSRFH